MALIELDVSQPWRPPDTPRPVRPVRRWLAVAVVGLLALALLVAAEPPSSFEPRLVVEGTGVQWFLTTSNSIFVLHQPNQGRTELAAYRLSDGAQLWSRPFAVATGLLYADQRSVVLSAAYGERTIVGLDPATGDVRWRRSGFDPGRSTDKVVVVEQADAPLDVRDPQPQALAGDYDDPDQRRLVGLDPATGEQRWSFRTLPRASHAYLGGPDDPDMSDENLLVELTQQGALRLYDLDTGALRSEVQLSEGAQIAGFNLVGGLLLAVQGRASRLTAYDLESGRLVWNRAAVGDGFLHNCGAILCLVRDTSIAGVEWSTGRQLWQLDGYVAVQQLDREQLLATTTHEYDRNAAVVNAVSGRITGYLPDWIVLTTTPSADVVVWLPNPDGGALIGLLRRKSDQITVFGHTGDWYVGPQCSVSGDFLACRSPTRLSVWPIPPP
jgi:outer membrane protein assembly factor BamB